MTQAQILFMVVVLLIVWGGFAICLWFNLQGRYPKGEKKV